MTLLNDVIEFQLAPLPDRERVHLQLAERLGSDWTPEPLNGEEDALPFVHVPTGVQFVAVPGGDFAMGLSEADLEEASEYIDWTRDVANAVAVLCERARPVHPVRVRPFLCSRQLLDVPQMVALSSGALKIDSCTRAEARALTTAHGLRLPSEAEWEWLARDGGRHSFVLDVAARQRAATPEQRALRSRFGVSSMSLLQWVEDDWHPSYAGAPSDSRPWVGDGDPRGVARAGFFEFGMQSSSELLFALAALRSEADEPCWVRLCADLSDE